MTIRSRLTRLERVSHEPRPGRDWVEQSREVHSWLARLKLTAGEALAKGLRGPAGVSPFALGVIAEVDAMESLGRAEDALPHVAKYTALAESHRREGDAEAADLAEKVAELWRGAAKELEGKA